MPAASTTCVCRHSYRAHTVGASHGCTFCKCEAFRDPQHLPPPPLPPLAETAQRALGILAKHSEFRNVPPEHLENLARRGRKRLFLAGQDLMLQGDTSDSLHILVKGSVRVERHVPGRTEPLLLAELHLGDVVGEMGVLNGDPRSASVTAADDVESLEIGAGALKEVFREEPDVLMAIMKVINERMKSTDDLVENTLRIAMAQLGDAKD